MQTTTTIAAHHQPPQGGERKAPPRSKRRRARRIVLGFALLFVVSQLLWAGLIEARPELRDPYFYDKFHALKRLQEQKRPARTIVAFGSSRTFYGIDALQIEERLDGEAGPVVVYNFGQFSAGPRLNSLYLHRLVALGCKPKLVLLEVLPPLLAARAEAAYEQGFVTPRRFHRSELDRAERYGWPRDRLDAEWRQSVLFPAYAMRLPATGRAAPWMLPPGVREDGSRQTDSRGSSWIDDARATPEARVEGIARTMSEYAAILGGDFRISETARLALIDALELCRREGIAIVLFLPPEAPSFRALYSAEAVRSIDGFLNELRITHRIDLIDGRDWLAESEFIDGHHPLRSGSQRASRMLAQRMAGPLVEAAWR